MRHAATSTLPRHRLMPLDWQSEAEVGHPAAYKDSVTTLHCRQLNNTTSVSWHYITSRHNVGFSRRHWYAT